MVQKVDLMQQRITYQTTLESSVETSGKGTTVKYDFFFICALTCQCDQATSADFFSVFNLKISLFLINKDNQSKPRQINKIITTLYLPPFLDYR